MAATELDMNDIKKRMQGTVQSFKHELSGLRTGRASLSMLDPVQVDAYGNIMPLNQVATVNVPEPRMIAVQVWDKGTVIAVDKAIREANLGLNPIVEGTLIRIPIPELNADRRKELVKVAHKYAESSRVSVRHVRRDGLDILKKAEKDGLYSEDDAKRLENEIQKATDSTITEIDQMLAAKEKDIMQV